MRSAYFKFLLLTTSCFLLAVSGWAQTRKVSGRIISEEDGKPLSGVSIIIKGTSGGTQTNPSGEFSIDVADRDVLVFSYTGFSPREISVGSSSFIDLSLKTSAAKLDEVVVVGYGTTRRSKMTSSVAKLDAKILETGLRSNPAQALAGTIPGVRVSTTTGRPGSLPGIILRGGTNFDGTGSPLIIMDGQVQVH